MIDLSRLDTATGSDEGRWLEPVGNDGKKIGMRIHVLGPDSKKYATLKEEVQREAYRILADVSSGLEPKENKLTDGERECKFYAKLTTEWEGVADKKGGAETVTWEGKPFPCTEENAYKLYSKASVIKIQVKNFIESRKNFTKPESVA